MSQIEVTRSRIAALWPYRHNPVVRAWIRFYLDARTATGETT